MTLFQSYLQITMKLLVVLIEDLKRFAWAWGKIKRALEEL
jgi:hypothetical protein